MPIEYRRETVTPAKARAWLGLNAANNRNMKKAKIEQYARDMTSGNWNSDSGETIKFSEDSTLIDGQNRLMAVIESGATVEFDVASGLPSSAMLVLDSGAMRGGGDALRIAGASERMRAAGVVRWSILWDAKVYTGRGGQINPTNTEIVTRYRSDAGSYNTATARGTDCQRLGIGTGRVGGMAFYLFAKIEKDGAHQFFDQLISGVGFVENSGPNLLLKRMMRVKLDRITPPEQLALFIRAWNAFRTESTMTQLIIARGELTNANFPQPK
jgi:hypothetical protein